MRNLKVVGQWATRQCFCSLSKWIDFIDIQLPGVVGTIIECIQRTKETERWQQFYDFDSGLGESIVVLFKIKWISCIP